MKWDYDAPPPKILVIKPRRGANKGRDRHLGRPLIVGVGDRILAKIRPAGDDTYEARPIKRLAAAPRAARRVMKPTPKAAAATCSPVDKRVPRRSRHLRRATPATPRPATWSRRRSTTRRATARRRPSVLEHLGRKIDHGKPQSQPHRHPRPRPAPCLQRRGPGPGRATPNRRAARQPDTDLRNIPLVTIDGEDARDFDDAVFAEPDTDAGNPGGWHILVAIADVAWYVRSGDALDRDAFARGNSVYFPDRVVPMLPEELSNGWCSLKPGEDRPCLAAHMWIIDAEGRRCSSATRSSAA